MFVKCLYSALIVVFFNFTALYSQSNYALLHWKWLNVGGLFINLIQEAEWIYCVKQVPRAIIYLDMDDAYAPNGKFFPQLFEEVAEEQIFFHPPGQQTVFNVAWTPTQTRYMQFHPSMKMKTFYKSSIPGDKQIYTDPDFAIYRQSLHPIVKNFFKPVQEIQSRIDSLMTRLNTTEEPSSKSYKIGIHVRCAPHYTYEGTSYRSENKQPPDENYLESIERDIDKIMESKDPKNTKIFLATLMQPLVDRLCMKYDVVIADNVPRTSDISEDWMDIKNANPLDIPRDAIVDGWCLSQCDEVWGGSSNVLLFIGILNPDLKIHLLPTLEKYNGI